MLFSFLMLTSLLMAQKGIKDTSEMCIPYSVAQKILLDLNDYDRVKQINTLNEKEIKELNNKIIYQGKVIMTWEEKRFY